MMLAFSIVAVATGYVSVGGANNDDDNITSLARSNLEREINGLD